MNKENEDTTSLPNESATSLPNESATSLPNESATSLPNESATSLPNESATSLPNESAKSLPNESAKSLPSENAISFPVSVHIMVSGDIQNAITDDIKDNVNKEMKRFSKINLNEVVSLLKSAGNGLKLAYASSKTYQCSANVISVLAKYQTLVGDTSILTNSFVNTCLTSLENHVKAIKFAKKDKLKSSITFLTANSESVIGLVSESHKLVKSVDELLKESMKGLEIAKIDNSVSTEEKSRIEKSIKDFKERQDKLTKETKELNEKVAKLKSIQMKLSKQADDKRNKAFVLSILSGVVNPAIELAADGVKAYYHIPGFIGPDFSQIFKFDPEDMNAINPEAASQENEIREMADQLMSDEEKNNSELASISHRLQTLKVEDNHLSVTIISLELVIAALGKIKAIFEDVEYFWRGVTHSNKLLDEDLKEQISKTDLKDEFITQLKLSGLRWLALGKICYTVDLCVKTSKNETDNIMNKLPTMQEAIAIVKNEADDTISSLKRSL